MGGTQGNLAITNSVSEMKPSRRKAMGSLLIDIPYEKYESEEIQGLIRFLRKKYPGINVENIEPGSIKLTLRGTPEELEEIEYYINALETEIIEGLKVKGFKLTENEEEKSPSKRPKVHYRATGRRKSSSARVILIPGSGKLAVNLRHGTEYFQYNDRYLYTIFAPLDTLGLEKSYEKVSTILKTMIPHFM